MPSRYYPQWRNQNTNSPYPFADEASLRSNSPEFVLTNDWLVDAAIYSPIAVSPVHISRVVVDGNIATVTLTDSVQQLVGTGVITRFSGNPIAIYDANQQPVATLVPSEASNSIIFSTGDGDFRFVEEATVFASSCVLQSPFASLSGFRVQDQTLVEADIVLVGERGVRLTVEESQEFDAAGQPQTVQLVRAHAIGDPQAITRICDEAANRPTRFIRELVFQYGNITHVCRPDELGNVLLVSESASVADSALRILVQPGEIKLELLGRSV